MGLDSRHLARPAEPELKKLALLETAAPDAAGLVDVAKQWAVLPPKIGLDALGAANARAHSRALCARVLLTSGGFAHDDAEQSLEKIDLLGGAGMAVAPPAPKVKPHNARIALLAFTPDSHVLVSTSTDRTVVAWNARDGAIVSRADAKVLKDATPGDYDITRIIPSPNNEWVLECLGNDQAVSLLFRLGDLTKAVYRVPQLGFAFSKDGRLILGRADRHRDTIEIDAMDRAKDANKTVSTRATASQIATVMRFTPDEKLIVAGYEGDGEVRAFLTERVTDVPFWTAMCHGGWIRKLRVSPDGKSVWASGSGNCRICRFDLATGATLESLDPRNSEARNLPDVSLDASCFLGWNDKDKLVELWNADSKKASAHFGGLGVTTVCWHPDSRRVLWADGITLHLWDCLKQADVTTFEAGKSSIVAIAVSPDGKWAATGSDDGEVRFWPMPDAKARENPKGQENAKGARSD